MNKANKFTWIISVCNTKYCATKIFTKTCTANQAESFVLSLALQDIEDDNNNYKNGVKDIGSKCHEKIYHAITGKVIQVNAYNTFSDYMIIYSAQRMDIVSGDKKGE